MLFNYKRLIVRYLNHHYAGQSFFDVLRKYVLFFNGTLMLLICMSYIYFYHTHNKRLYDDARQVHKEYEDIYQKIKSFMVSLEQKINLLDPLEMEKNIQLIMKESQKELSHKMDMDNDGINGDKSGTRNESLKIESAIVDWISATDPAKTIGSLGERLYGIIPDQSNHDLSLQSPRILQIMADNSHDPEHQKIYFSWGIMDKNYITTGRLRITVLAKYFHSLLRTKEENKNNYQEDNPPYFFGILDLSHDRVVWWSANNRKDIQPKSVLKSIKTFDDISVNKTSLAPNVLFHSRFHVFCYPIEHTDFTIAVAYDHSRIMSLFVNELLSNIGILLGVCFAINLLFHLIRFIVSYPLYIGEDILETVFNSGYVLHFIPQKKKFFKPLLKKIEHIKQHFFALESVNRSMHSEIRKQKRKILNFQKKLKIMMQKNNHYALSKKFDDIAAKEKEAFLLRMNHRHTRTLINLVSHIENLLSKDDDNLSWAESTKIAKEIFDTIASLAMGITPLLSKENINLRAMIESCIKIYTPKFFDENATIYNFCPMDLTVENADPIHMQFMLVAIFFHLSKAIQTDQKVNITAEYIVEGHNSYIRIQFEDDGFGIDDSDVTKTKTHALVESSFTTVDPTKIDWKVLERLVKVCGGRVEMEAVLQEGRKTTLFIPKDWEFLHDINKNYKANIVKLH